MTAASTTAKRGNGHSNPGSPAFVPTDEQRAAVAAMSSCDIPQESIRQLVINPHTGQPISKPTLHKHFRDELNSSTGKLMTSIAVGRLGKDMLSNENRGTRAAIFWLKTRERELFAERRIRENLPATDAMGVEHLTPEDRERVALSVLEQIRFEREQR